MHSLLEKKPLVLLFSVLALGALVVLSVSMRGMSFGDAQPIGKEEVEQTASSQQVVSRPTLDEDTLSRIILYAALSFLLALTTVLLSKEGRKRLFRFIIRMAFILWALYFLSHRYPGTLSFLQEGMMFNSRQPSNVNTGESIPPPVFTPPREVPWMTYVVSLLVIFGVLYLLWRAYRIWQVMNRPPAKSLQDLARIARASLRDLSDGRETTDVIMNCYFRMSDVVSDRKNIQRGLGMTPAEFAFRLEEAGLPGDAVKRLTRLFESVRYGGRKAGPKDVNEAVSCLTTILQYCGEPV